MQRLLLLSVLALSFALMGCQTRGGTAGGSPKPTVSIRAYINVSSGCQQATVELLQALADRYKPRVNLELVDFGDGATGARRWQQSAHTCMTIEINGSPHVSYPTPAGQRTMAFQMPAGFLWTHEDLEMAVAAAAQGTLRTVDPQAAAAALPPQTIKAKVGVKEPKSAGQPAFLTLNSAPVIRVAVTAGDKSPVQRVRAAAQVLQAWLSKPVKLSDLTVKQGAEGWAVLVGPKVVLVATKADAKAASSTPEKLANSWSQTLRQRLVGPKGR